MKQQNNLFMRFYLFLKDRDARTVELFFWALNTYIFILILAPPYNTTGTRLIIRIIIQLTVTTINTLALIWQNKELRMISSILNTSVMALITASLIYSNNPNAGTYALLCLLSAFVCWKINIKQ